MAILERRASLDDAVVPHYQLVGPIMEQIFHRIPIVWTTPNPQANRPPIYHAKYFGHYSHLSSEHVQHLAVIGAQEFHSWFPIVEDPQRARFARFLLERPWADTQGAPLEPVRRGARIIGDLPKAEGYGAIPVLDGVGGVSIFIPLVDGPSYPDVRMWAHAIARKSIAANADLFSEAPNVHNDGRCTASLVRTAHNADYFCNNVLSDIHTFEDLEIWHELKRLNPDWLNDEKYNRLEASTRGRPGSEQSARFLDSVKWLLFLRLLLGTSAVVVKWPWSTCVNTMWT